MIIIQIASIPDREEMLRKTVESLRPQCDRNWVGLNNYTKAPDFLKEGEYKFFDNSTGDAVKFYNAENLEGWVLTCDDDLIYPEGYVEYMRRKTSKHQCPVSLHGKEYPRPVIAFNEILKNHRCLDKVEEDVFIDVPGTGVLCYHTDLIKVAYADFKRPNMADLWFAKLVKEQGLNLVCAAHEKGYLKYQHPAETIWNICKKDNFIEQTQLLKTFL